MEQQELIQHLRYQEKKLEGQLEAVRQTIQIMHGAFSDKPVQVEIPENQFVKAPAPKAAESVDESTKRKDKSGPTIKNGNELFPAKGKKARRVIIPNEYKNSASYTKKIAYLLLNEGPMSSVQLVDRVAELEPETPREKIERSVTIGASNMFRKGLVKAKREGRRYIYSV